MFGFASIKVEEMKTENEKIRNEFKQKLLESNKKLGMYKATSQQLADNYKLIEKSSEKRECEVGFLNDFYLFRMQSTRMLMRNFCVSFTAFERSERLAHRTRERGESTRQPLPALQEPPEQR